MLFCAIKYMLKSYVIMNMLTFRRIAVLLLLSIFLFAQSSCGLISRSRCPALSKQNKRLISGKETYGVKNKKYKKQSRKVLCYYIR